MEWFRTISHGVIITLMVTLIIKSGPFFTAAYKEWKANEVFRQKVLTEMDEHKKEDTKEREAQKQIYTQLNAAVTFNFDEMKALKVDQNNINAAVGSINTTITMIQAEIHPNHGF